MAPRPADGTRTLVAGSSGSGKTAWTRRQISGARRLLVWDGAGEWSRDGLVDGCARLSDVHARIRSYLAKPGAFRVGYCGPVTREAFDTFCRLAWVWIRAARGGVLVVEELADVTTPGKAPPAWGEIVRKSRHYGAEVYALTQRPAESDKTILGNASLIHCGLMSSDADRRYMARVLDVPLVDVANLAELEFIERDTRTRQLRRGRLTFQRRR